MNSIKQQDLLEWLSEKAQNVQHNPGDPPKFLIILPSNIVKNNLIRGARLEGIRTDLIEVLTFEDLAAKIVKDNQNRSAEILDARVLTDLIQIIIQSSNINELDILRPLPLNERETKATIVNEYEEYLRCSYLGTLHTELLNIVNALSSDFEKEQTRLRLNALKTLEEQISQVLTKLHADVFQTRHHLLKSATESLYSKWPEFLRNIKFIAISAITVFDSLATHLISALCKACSQRDIDIDILCGRGTFESLVNRFSRFLPLKADETKENERTILQSTLASNINMERIEVPDRRREILVVASEIRRKLLNGIKPHEILLVARDCGKYLSFIKDIFPSYGIPFYLQTRRLYAHQHQYGFMRSLLELAATSGSGDPISWDVLTSPLRLGFCTKGRKIGWPVEAREVFYLEERLAWIQNTEYSDGFSLDEWKTLAGSKLGWDSARNRLFTFIDDVKALLRIPTDDVKEIINLLKTFWHAFIERQANWKSDWEDPRVNQNERFVLTKRHPTSFETQLRNELNDLERYLLDYTNISESLLTWREIAYAFTRLVLSETYGLRDLDLAAVPFVDAGNAWFRRAKHVYLLGMRAEEFPRKCPEGMIFQTEFRKSLNYENKAISPFFYLRNPENDYESESDFFEAALRSVQESVTFVMPYLDERGHTQAWSPFVDQLTGQLDRFPPDYWLPNIENSTKQERTELSEWTRWNLFTFHSHRKATLDQPVMERCLLEELGSGLDPDQFEMEIKPRITRFITPPMAVQVNSSEPWLGEQLLHQLAGPPYHSHELDLHAICPMQFYFYQFLYNLFGDEYSRNTIPPAHLKFQWRYGPIPRRLSHIYCDALTNKSIKKCTDFWSPRTELSKIVDEQDFVISLQKITNRFSLKQMIGPFRGDWNIACSEENAQLSRDWSWEQGGATVTLSSPTKSVEVILPPHRLDRLNDNILVLAYVNYSQQIKRLWYSVRDRRNRYCPIPDPINEHRLPILLTHYQKVFPNKVAGGVYIELFSGFRKGYFHSSLKSKHRENPPKIQLLHFQEWKRRLTEFTKAIVKRASEMTPTDHIVYRSVRPSGYCGECVYRTLCHWEGGY